MAEENGHSEDQRERVNRELVELLQELRVALPGVQVLFAFLLTVPFSQGFVNTTTFQRDLFFGTLAATAVSTTLLIAPSAWHRIHFRQKDKEDMLFASNKLTIAGLFFLALAMIGAVTLIADFAFSSTLAVISGIAGVVVLGAFWAAIPVVRRPGREPT
jgi:hypothetical protein